MDNSWSNERERMNIIHYFFIIISITYCSYSQALDNEFQSYYAKVVSIIQKNTEELTVKEVEVLKDATKMNINHFGESYQHSMRQLIQNANRKLNEYNEFLAKKRQTEEEMFRKQRQIEVTESQLRKTEMERDSAIQFSEMLKKEIEKLNKKIKELTNDKKNLEKANKMLLEDNQNYQAIISNTRSSISRIINLIGYSSVNSELSAQIPQSLKDSLEIAECGIAETLMKNYNLTLNAMLKDAKFIDTIAKYYKQNKSLPSDVQEYIDSGKDLAEKMSLAPMDCIRISGINILNSIENFILEVENQSNRWKLDDIILIPVIAILIILIVFVIILIRKRRN